MPFSEKFSFLGTPQLHEIADQWNWDDGLEELHLIIEHPACALGTALLIYWRGHPHYFRQYTHRDEVEYYNRDNYDLLMRIEEKMKRGDFRYFGINYDPRNDLGGVDLTIPPSGKGRFAFKPKRAIPSYMCLATTSDGIEQFQLKQ